MVSQIPMPSSRRFWPAKGRHEAPRRSWSPGLRLTVPAGVLLAAVLFGAALAPGRPGPVFSDEFDGTRVDLGRWASGYPWGCTNGGTGERQCYTPDALAVRDGLLVIEADRRETNGMPYRSGMITSHDSFSQRYGYFELRARLPRGKGLWPAFWLLPKPTGTWPPELDVMEQIGSEPNTVLMAQHYRDAAGVNRKHARTWTGPDFTAGFHTFALSWGPRAIVWYVDGVERFRSEREIPTEEMYVLVNLAVGGESAGEPDATTSFPSRMEVDYLRVWKDPDAGPVTPNSWLGS
jgi:beta-glucanase (GH16 family)